MEARSAREWSSEAVARAICPNSLRRRCCISVLRYGALNKRGGKIVFLHVPFDHKFSCIATTKNE